VVARTNFFAGPPIRKVVISLSEINVLAFRESNS
jgi:hypothetical protein